MAATPALDLLIRSKTVHSVVTYHHDPSVESFGDEAATALGVEPTRVFKTLVVRADEGLVVGVVPTDAVLEMADAASAARSSGYVVGGISPLGQKHPLATVIDESANDFATIFVSGGRRGLEIELSPGDLAKLTTGRFAAIARKPSGQVIDGALA
jgi:Cys-tRNA(Pro)/Cys-tRNA(Cys) deacylase